MKSRFLFGLLVILIANLPLAISAMISQDYVFESPVITEIDGEHWIAVKDCRPGGIPGTPVLPSYGVRLLLPPGEGVASVRIIPGEHQSLGTGYQIPPNQAQVPLSFSGTFEEIPADPAIYGANRAYPYEMNTRPFTQGYCGHTIAYTTISPVSYNPVTGEVWWYPSLRVELETAPEPEAATRLQTLYRTNARILKNLEQWVDNIEIAGLYPAVIQDRDEEWDMVIITNAALESSFQVLEDFKNRRGIRTRIETTEWIYANYTGTDNQDKIRNYIIDAYNNWGIQYALLGGDGDASGGSLIIPHRGVYAASHYGGGDETDYNLPCDLYYGGLDGNWNSDGDGQYGEEVPEEADFIAEVHIGRASVDNATEAGYFVNKQIMYQQSPVVNDCDDVLFAGELLWDDPGDWTFGRQYIEEVRWGSSNHGYTTVGMDNPATADTLYDQYTFYPGEWSGNGNLKPKLNAGCNFLNHLGHCNETYMTRFYNSDITDANLTNDGITHNFYVIYSQGCLPGSFEYNDCIAENWTGGIAHGAVAIVCNSRYGWGYHESTRGSSNYFHREFVDAMYGEDIYHISYANDDSKEDCLPWITSDDMANRWCALELNVFGDPELDIWTAEPTTLSPSYDPAYVIGTGTFDVDAGVEGALVACNFGGELIGRGYTNVTGNVTITLDPDPTETGDMEVVITAHNYLEHSGTVSVISPSGPYVVYDTLIINDLAGNNDGLLDFAETVKLNITIENVGNETALGVQCSIYTSDAYTSILDDTCYYGDILASAKKAITDGFEISVVNTIPDLHIISFTLTATDGDSIWTNNFTITAHAPDVTIEQVDVMDGDNGRLDANETTDLDVTLHNGGSADVANVLAVLSTLDSYIAINVNSDNLTSLGADASGVVTFNVTTDSETPEGHSVDFDVDITGDNYSTMDQFSLTIGLSLEDFETGAFTNYPWNLYGHAPWTIVSTGAYEGTYCAKSGTISDNGYSEMSVNLDVVADGSISFYYKVSSEIGYDFLKFYIDGVQKSYWSGEAGWAQASFAVTTGNHTFAWRYTKDGNTLSGNDCAWVDYIVFPSVAAAPELPIVNCYDFESGDQGWTMGAPDDDASTGLWERTNPEGTWNSDRPVQPEDDHSDSPGVNCWVTDGRAGTGIGTYDIDGGKTTLFSPIWDLSGYANAAVELWSWYSNDEGTEAGDYFVMDVSSNGGTDWVNVLTTNNDWEYWRKDFFFLDDYIALTSQVQLRVVASDEDPGSVVDVAVDDVCLFGSNPQPPEPVTDVTALVNGTDIELYWTAPVGATSYNVYRISDPFATPTPGDLIGTPTSPAYTDENVLLTETKAFYVIVAVN